MEETLNRKSRWSALGKTIAVAVVLLAGSLGYRYYKESTMPPPFVYLIPADYFGPVVTFFGQPDGVEMQPDPLGHAVEVPASGIVKVRARRQDVMGISHEGYQAVYWISVSKDRTRKPMKYLTDVYREKGIFWQGVIGEGPLVRYDIGPETNGNFDHLLEALRDERLIAANQGCRFRFVDADEASQEAGCDEFLVISPNEDLATDPWMWDDFGHYFSSLADFEPRSPISRKRRRRTSVHCRMVRPRQASSTSIVPE